MKDKVSKADWTYEAKCRRCGKVEEWFFAHKKDVQDFDFAMAMIDYVKAPRLMSCDKRNKNTVQDVVAY